MIELSEQLSDLGVLGGEEPTINELRPTVEIFAEKLRERPPVVDHSIDEGRILGALEAAWPFPRLNPSVLLFFISALPDNAAH